MRSIKRYALSNITESAKRLPVAAAVLCLLLITPSLPQTEGESKVSAQLLRYLQDAGLESRVTAWIYFRDKGPDESRRLAAARAALTPRARVRRLRHRPHDKLVDEYDIPVYEEYVSRVRMSASRLRQVSRWLNAVSVEAKGRRLLEIAEWPLVTKVERVARFRFRKPGPASGITTQGGLQAVSEHALDYGPSFSQVNQLNVPALHDMGFTGSGILVCILDGGFGNLGHQALDHLDIVATWDFVNNDPVVSDESGQMGSGDHGTQTLGAMAGYFPGELIGPAYGASFLLGKTENDEWERHIEEDHWIAGAEWADTLGADIISSSLGYREEFTHGEPDYSWQDMDGRTTIVAQGANIAAERGILILNSAGNEGLATPPENSLVSPSDCPRVLAVGAVNSSGWRVSFSSTGPTADGRIKPDIMAQGQDVYAPDPVLTDAYEYVDGTSFSCPLAAGVAALLLEAHPTWTNDIIMEAMKRTASRADIPDNTIGYGIVDAQAALGHIPKNLFPPSVFRVYRRENDYIFFKQFVDRLSWARNPRNSASILGYRLYARRTLSRSSGYVMIAEVDAETFSFERRGLLGTDYYIYKIISISRNGEESDPEFTWN